MKFSDLKYISGCFPPIVSFLGLYLGGWFSPGLLYFGLVAVPLLELFVPASTFNEDESVYQKKLKYRYFDILLYLQVPMLYATLGYFVWKIGHVDMTSLEQFFSVLNVGMMIGVSGINVAHELGHRQSSFDRLMSRCLLVPALYSHYTLEHNYGHHLNVGTPADPATARKNEPVYTFYFRTILGSYRNAWKIGKKILKQKNQPGWKHEIILMHLIQLVYLAVIFYFSGLQGVVVLVLSALIGVLFLESVNYIEHYGLIRKQLPSGRYEPMNDTHSWNSNHELGRALLFELVRHADHHFQTTREYETLRHLEKSPQLPFGYPMSILLALIPPLWFKVMNPRIEPAMIS
jgi:alkane 1-monooxygenase